MSNDHKLVDRPLTASPTNLYKPTEDEQAAMQGVRARRIKTPRVKMTESKERIELSLDHPDPAHGQALLMRSLGTGEVDFFSELLAQLGRASANGPQGDEQRLNFMIAVIKGIEPKDQLETMLAAQMAAIHSMTMEFASRLGVCPRNHFFLDQTQRDP